MIQLSGFLDQIQPGDVIFADRGFPVKDLVAERRASLVLPASTKGKKQLSSSEILSSRKNVKTPAKPIEVSDSEEGVSEYDNHTSDEVESESSDNDFDRDNN
ncbi:hypothetical protein TNCT_240631 [Trichonephila clavata]|uniref:DDE Tnp4 domain-containing protein n=1 Tax=Trichonephila clavata TaxID=2740835 RepID=A0A8X6KQ25_TRICU|nr:hypothetical protein TNCT_240631 [Trichonephila clavata]